MSALWRRYVVVRCDEQDGSHTWDVVDRSDDRVVHNCDTRSWARRVAHELESEAVIARMTEGTGTR